MWMWPSGRIHTRGQCGGGLLLGGCPARGEYVAAVDEQDLGKHTLDSGVIGEKCNPGEARSRLCSRAGSGGCGGASLGDAAQEQVRE
eukprot:3206221-Prorocentrum_lima.AAC.1